MCEENILREEEWERACARLLKTRWRQQHRGEFRNSFAGVLNKK